MTQISCKDYGFECDYNVEGNGEEIIEKFGEHFANVHGIEYSKEVLKQILKRKISHDFKKKGIILEKEEVEAIVTLLDFAYSSHPVSFFEKDLKIDHRLIQQLIFKLSETI